MNAEKDESVLKLLEAISLLQNSDETAEFLKDLCTIGEISSMARRLEAAVLLYNGENYVDVSEKTGISTATISRVSKCLKQNGGYVKIIERMKDKTSKDNK